MHHVAFVFLCIWTLNTKKNYVTLAENPALSQNVSKRSETTVKNSSFSDAKNTCYQLLQHRSYLFNQADISIMTGNELIGFKNMDGLRKIFPDVFYFSTSFI